MQKIGRSLADAGSAVALSEIGVKEGGKALHSARLGGSAAIGGGAVGVVDRLATLTDNERRTKFLRADGGKPVEECAAKCAILDLGQSDIVFSRCEIYDLGGGLCRDTEISRRQIGGGIFLGCGLRKSGKKALLCFRERIFFVLGGGHLIGHAQKKLALAAGGKIHRAQNGQHAIVLVRQNEVAILPHHFHEHIFLAGVAHLVIACKGKACHAFKADLLSPKEARTGQMLAQKHAEHRGGCGIFLGDIRKGHVGNAWPCVDHKAVLLPVIGKDEIDLVPCRL